MQLFVDKRISETHTKTQARHIEGKAILDNDTEKLRLRDREKERQRYRMEGKGE